MVCAYLELNKRIPGTSFYRELGAMERLILARKALSGNLAL